MSLDKKYVRKPKEAAGEYSYFTRYKVELIRSNGGSKMSSRKTSFNDHNSNNNSRKNSASVTVPSPLKNSYEKPLKKESNLIKYDAGEVIMNFLKFKDELKCSETLKDLEP